MLVNLYTDSLSAYRSVKVVNEFGRTIQKTQKVYTNIPCRLSQGRLHTTQSGVVNASTNTYKVFLDSKYTILQNDSLVVVKAGVTYNFKASKGIKYDRLIPHQEIPVEEVEENDV